MADEPGKEPESWEAFHPQPAMEIQVVHPMPLGRRGRHGKGRGGGGGIVNEGQVPKEKEAQRGPPESVRAWK